MEFAILRGGLIKTKNYCPNPIARYGIPSYADAYTNPKVKNTPAYNSWWEEQIYHIINGYTTGGITVPGRYYKFVNFDTIRGVAGDNQRAKLFDYQLDYAYLIEAAKKEFFNIYVPKARRKAVTTMTVCMVIDYGYRFELGYKAGIIAGKETFAKVFYEEWMYTDAKQFREFRIKRLSKGEDTIAGYKYRDTDGEEVDGGTMNSIYLRTVFHDPNVMKGKYLNDCVLEESGENENLIECINGTRDCLMDGTFQRGVFYIYGTGGNMNKGSKGFKKVYFDSLKENKFNTRVLFIPATVMLAPYYAGSVDRNGISNEIIPNLQHLKDYERVGWCDEEAAGKYIEDEKKKLLLAADLKEYFDFCQNNPTNIKEVFRQSASNNFPVIKLSDQGFQIDSLPQKYKKYKLEYKKDDKTGMYLIPLQVEAIAAEADIPEADCVLILDEGHPVSGYRNLDVAGIDSYDLDQSTTSKSLGAMVVFRRAHNIAGLPSKLPVAVIRNRPARKEMFYELCMKLSIYYNLIGSVLVDIRTPLIVQYFKDAGLDKFISLRPKKFESAQTKAGNEFGLSINATTRPKMVGVLQTYYFLYSENIWFPDIITESLAYDEYEDGSDNDTVDALGLALIKDIDEIQVPIDEIALYKNNPYALPEYEKNFEGNLIDIQAMKELNAIEPLGKYEDWFCRQARLMRGLEAEEKENQSEGAYSMD